MRRQTEERRLPQVERSAAEEACAASFVGVSAHSEQVRRACARAAPNGRTVMLIGETGSGKQVVAELLHRLSGRTGPFVATAAGEVGPELAPSEYFGHEPGAYTGAQGRRIGYIQSAHRGTLYLDEVQDMPVAIQMQLRQFLDGNGFPPAGTHVRVKPDVRVIGASQRPLNLLVAEGRLRADFMYRLQQCEIRLLPLRERMEDLEPIARVYLGGLAANLGVGVIELTAGTLAVLASHVWPGNVRELQSVLHAAALEARGRLIEPRHLPRWFYEAVEQGPKALGTTNAERARLEAVLKETRGNLTRAATRLGTTPKTLRSRLRRAGIDIGRIRGR